MTAINVVCVYYVTVHAFYSHNRLLHSRPSHNSQSVPRVTFSRAYAHVRYNSPNYLQRLHILGEIFEIGTSLYRNVYVCVCVCARGREGVTLYVCVYYITCI